MKEGLLAGLLFLLASFSLESNGKVIQPNKVEVRNTNVFLTQNEKYYLSNKKTLRVGVNLPSFIPFDIVEEGQDNILYSGISSEVIAIISDILDIELDFYFFKTRNEAIAAILKNEIDLITSSNGYELQFGLILSEIYFPDRPILFRSSKINEIKTVSVAYEYLDSERLRSVFPHIEFFFYPSREEAIAAAVFGEVDAVINDLLSLNHSYNNHYIGDLKYQEVIQEVDSKGFAFSFDANNTMLRNIFNKVIASIDTNTLQLIVHRWNGGGITPPTLNELAYIKENVVNKFGQDEISVVVMPHQAPFSYLDEFDNPQGILVELLNLFNIYTGVKINLIVEKELDNAFSLLKNGQVDLVAINESKSRREHFLISDVILRNPFVYVTHKNVMLHDIESVVTTKNSIIKEMMDLSNYKNIQTDGYLSALTKVVSDKKSTAIMPISIANFYIYQYFFEDLEVNGINYELPNAKVAFAALNDNKELMDFVNGLLREIPKGQIEVIANMWRKNAVVANNTWKDYKYTVYTLSISMIIILFLVIIYIVLARKALKIERNLKNQNSEQLNFLQDIVDSIPHPIYFMSENFKIKVSNEAFKSIFNYQNSHSFYFLKRLGYPQYLKLIRRHKEVIQLNESSVEDYTLYIDNQKYVIYHWLRAYSDINGHTSGVIGGWLDISERAKLLDEIEDAKIEAESANSAKSLFLATMSHEIRTPMNVIIGALDLVINYDYSSDEKNKHLNIAYDSAKDLLSLIGDILDLSKIEANELNIIPKDANFKDTISSIFNMFYGLAKQKNVRLIKSYDDTIEPFLMFDDLRLKQILLNVLSNAVKFTDEGSIQIKFVNLGVFDNHQEIKIVIKDTGIGIKQEEVDKLFKTFSQTSSSYNRGGTGLGLMITKNLCELMSGKMDLSSQADIGTTVSMIFKFPIVENITLLYKNSVEDKDKEEPFEKKKILLVDDHPSNRIILSKQIEQLGHEVLTACDGYDALSVLDKNVDINVVITDCHMPEMDGYELTRNIRDRFFSRNNLIILGLTANAQADIKEKCLLAGMDDCLFKPLDIKELESRIHVKYNDNANAKKVKVSKPNLVINKDVLIYLMNAGVDLTVVFDEFVKTTSVDLSKLSQSNILEDQMELIHRIKSASNMLGFQGIIKICLSIESKYKLEDKDIEHLQSEFNDVIVAMGDFLS
ncbi:MULTISPECIES: response regulator [Vibrio]|uniref:response regulator n=1 Tax=Vibrio TaxID=662 RepID=UPI001483929E|nr:MULTISPECIES: transporter substrate-binding domain-containing protein [Vibrio]MDQ2164971.1 transporter substrate-binding domain-containing protein [Vibrio anguillarum]NNN96375.1 transporter substrate-binding domain-containing protein [Vibrio sp. B4-6]